MNGGHFDYKQYILQEIIDSIQLELNNQGKQIDSVGHSDSSRKFIEEYPEYKYYRTYSSEIQLKFREAIEYLKKAMIYSQRIDWLLSGDDSEESFLKRLNDEIHQMEEESFKDEIIRILSRNINCINYVLNHFKLASIFNRLDRKEFIDFVNSLGYSVEISNNNNIISLYFVSHIKH